MVTAGGLSQVACVTLQSMAMLWSNNCVWSTLLYNVQEDRPWMTRWYIVALRSLRSTSTRSGHYATFQQNNFFS